ncbi:MAG: hypothetical protein ACI89E_000845 [Planctomycetota bacterium]|jgi:hypothetical protein
MRWAVVGWFVVRDLDLGRAVLRALSRARCRADELETRGTTVRVGFGVYVGPGLIPEGLLRERGSVVRVGVEPLRLVGAVDRLGCAEGRAVGRGAGR